MPSLHHAFNDYDGFRRGVFRIAVEGEKPHQHQILTADPGFLERSHLV